LLPAAALAFVLAQLAFVGHDAGHRQVCSSRRGNNLLGLVHANLLTGFSYGWWLAKHNRHHAYTNRLDKDPDVGAGALTFTAEQTFQRGAPGRVFARFQAALLIPLLTLEAINLHYSSIVALARRRDRAAISEAFLLTVHLGVFLGGPFFVMPAPRAACFIVVSQGLFGLYLGGAFVTNHIGMPLIRADNDLGFLRRQVLTSRNLSGGRLVTFFSGGLSHQVEHHLFPTAARSNLPRLREMVGSYCAELGIDYRQQSVVSAYRDVLRHLRLAGLGRAVAVVG